MQDASSSGPPDASSLQDWVAFCFNVLVCLFVSFVLSALSFFFAWQYFWELGALDCGCRWVLSAGALDCECGGILQLGPWIMDVVGAGALDCGCGWGKTASQHTTSHHIAHATQHDTTRHDTPQHNTSTFHSTSHCTDIQTHTHHTTQQENTPHRIRHTHTHTHTPHHIT